jgi:hypothetical protein
MSATITTERAVSDKDDRHGHSHRPGVPAAAERLRARDRL